MTAQNQSPLLHRRRRGQKQKRGFKQPIHPPGRVLKNAQTEALSQHIRRLDTAKRRIRLFNKVTLFIAVVCVGNNIYNKVSNLRHNRGFGGNGGGGGGGASSSVLGEAFQSNFFAKWKKQNNNNNHFWPLFGNSRNDYNSDHIHVVPRELLQPLGVYPNILNITAEMRKGFHPVVKIPLRRGNGKDKGVKPEEGTCIEFGSPHNQHRTFSWPWQKRRQINRNNNPSSGQHGSSCIAATGAKMNATYDYIVRDYTGNNDNDNRVLLQGGKRVPQLVSTRNEALEYAKLPKQTKKFDVGRYDEDRKGMYTSSLFLEEGITDETNRRTVHVGLDIGAPVGTSVYAFEDGIVHSAGYNPELGDYGHVIVIEHALRQDQQQRDGKNQNEKITSKVVYALYGHLGAKGIQGKIPGQKIKKGQVIGFVGNTAENGGWTGAHLHFQLAVSPPKTHDMPGVVTLKQREEALLEYLDPRYVLGELY
mmetsp:Transcript_36172/g.76022  ORF Transcript_36172/g.76022 Transcript_36172/m.76022 type:complete len:476 (+) Transcript_36172:241-1668(+)